MRRSRTCFGCSTSWSPRTAANSSRSGRTGVAWSATRRGVGTGYGRSLTAHPSTCSGRCRRGSTGRSGFGCGGAPSTTSSAWLTCSNGSSTRRKSGHPRPRGSRSTRGSLGDAFSGRWTAHGPSSTVRRCRCTRSGGRSPGTSPRRCPNTCRSTVDYTGGHRSCSCYSGCSS